MNIGTKVRITFEDGTMTDKDYTIVSTKNYKEVKDWCDHYIVRSEDGDEQEIRMYSCVFPPIEGDEYRVIDKFLSDNGIYAEVYPYSPYVPAVVVSISWGDWKHDHGWATDLMHYLGYREIGGRVTEENGSDCYSADHYYLKSETTPLAAFKVLKDIATRENG